MTKTMERLQETKKTNSQVDNSPNAAFLTIALRNLGYDNLSAISDITDNAFDAEATKVKVYIRQRENQPEIIIADNGNGMGVKTLDQALRLGSDVERDLSTALGKFGMGLCTGSMSIAKRLEVITKTKESDVFLKSSTDVDEIVKTNRFIKYLGEANKEDIELFNSIFGDEKSGTIVVMKKCDQLRSTNISQFKNRVRNELSRVFREFIFAGKEIYVNDEKCEGFDPLMSQEKGTELYSDEEYEVEYKDEETGNTIKDTIRVRLAILPDYGYEGNAERKINTANSGFYVMRNNREVLSAKTLNFFTKHPSFNRFRGEIYFGVSLDVPMGVDFTKSGLDMHQSIFDKLNKDLTHQLASIRKKIQKAKMAENAEGVNHNESERQISRKSSLLLTPKPKKKEEKKEGRKVNKPENKKTEKIEKEKKQRYENRVRFEAQHDGKGGHIYEARMEGKQIVIVWNIDHPFYERFVVMNKHDKTMSTSIDFLVYSLATAELQITNDETLAMLETYKTIMSANLNTLLR